ncbi:MAG: fasciclin domain-containing protein [Gemmatimonadota bacterium]|nr:fasciclin domain-containing protein [Gemmatimonadota bacterium]
MQNLVQTAVAAEFNTLVTALQAAGLDQTLATDGPFTVFAPSDAAFAALPAGTLDALLQDPDALRDVLLYHVVSGEVLASQVVNLTTATTLQGGTVSIDASSGVKVNDATVIQTDVLATNGVIHVIDKVLIPNSN